jgi:hypothetical protein
MDALRRSLDDDRQSEEAEEKGGGSAREAPADCREGEGQGRACRKGHAPKGRLIRAVVSASAYAADIGARSTRRRSNAMA